MSLVSISTSTKLSISLDSLGGSPEALRKVRAVLGKRDGDQYKPRLFKLYAWQIPELLLNVGILLSIADLIVHVWGIGRSAGASNSGDGTEVSLDSDVFMFKNVKLMSSG